MDPILVVDDMAVTRELLTSVLELSGYPVLAAADGLNCLAILERQPVALILLDLKMPRLDGLALLEKIRAHSPWTHIPVILLTATKEKDAVLRALHLGIQGFVLKDQFHTKAFCDRVAKCLADPVHLQPHAANFPTHTCGSTIHESTAEHPPFPTEVIHHEPAGSINVPHLLTREETLDRLARLPGAKTLAGVVGEVIAMTDSSRADLHELVQVLERDSLLASRVLQVANSAAYATTKKMTMATLPDSVRNIGVNAVRNIAASVGIFESFPANASDGFNLIHSWQHAFAVGSLMDAFAANLPEQERHLAYMVGLCHELGEIVLRQSCAAEFEQAINTAAELKRPVNSLYYPLFGITPSELTGRILTQLGLPLPIAHPIHEFSEALRTGTHSPLCPLARLLKVANNCAHGLLLASSAHDAIAPISVMELPHGRENNLLTDTQALNIRADVLAMTRLMARLSAAEEQKLSQTLIPTTALRIWYTRHPGLSFLDPLGHALQLISCVSISDVLPATAEELEQVDCLIVATPRANLDGFGTSDVMHCLEQGARPDLPVLHVACQSGEAINPLPPSFVATHFPLKLSALAAFLDRANHPELSTPCAEQLVAV